jgi:hypothetical protein
MPTIAATVPSVRESSNAVPAYSFKAGSTASDLLAVVALWRYGDGTAAGLTPPDLSRFTWFYSHNPQGLSHLGFAVHGAEQTPVGCIGIGARRFFVRGAEVAFGVLVDFVVSPKHRSVFPALLLQRQGRSHALASMQAVYGLPDLKAVAVCKRLETHVSFELPRYVRIVRSMVYLQRLAPGWVILPFAALVDLADKTASAVQLMTARVKGSWVESFDARFDRLWDRVDKSGMCIGDRRSAFLHWRYKQQPNRKYLVFAIHHKKSEEIAMYFVCETGNGGLKVKDFLSDEGSSDIKAGLLLLSQQARRMGLNFVEIEIAGSDAIKSALKRAQFTSRSSRPFFAVINEPFRNQAQAVPWYITAADEDV